MYPEGRKKIQKLNCLNLFTLNKIKVITIIKNSYFKNKTQASFSLNLLDSTNIQHSYMLRRSLPLFIFEIISLYNSILFSAKSFRQWKCFILFGYPSSLLSFFYTISHIFQRASTICLAFCFREYGHWWPTAPECLPSPSDASRCALLRSF